MAAEVIKVILLVCYTLISITGAGLNGMIMYALVHDKDLRKKMASVRWLMFGDAFCEFMVCLVAVPLMAASVMIGAAPPFTTSPILCHSVVLIGYGLGVTSFWYQTVIALTRLAAVMVPNWYRLHVKTTLANVVLLVCPWIFAYTGYVAAAADRAYYIRPVAGTGSCETAQYDESKESAKKYAIYVLADTITNEWSSMLIGFSFYIAIYVRIWYMDWKISKRQIQPMPTPVANNNSQIVVVSAFPPKADKYHAERDGPSVISAVAHYRLSTHSQDRDKKIKFLSIAYAVNICILLPINLVYGLNYYDYLVGNYPVIAQLLDMSWYTVFPLNPLVYALVSAEFRRAILRR